jgi:hypothetical protein
VQHINLVRSELVRFKHGVREPAYRAQHHHLNDAKLNRQYTMGITPGPSAQDERRFAARSPHTSFLQRLRPSARTFRPLLPLYPQFSWTTTGSSFRDWETVRKKKFGDKAPWKEFHVKNYHRNEDYLAAVNDRIDEALAGIDGER